MSDKKCKSCNFLFKPFNDLKKNIDDKKTSPGELFSRKKEKTANDEELFIKAMRNVREIKEFRRITVNRRKSFPLYISKSSAENSLKVLEEIVTGKRPINLSDTQEYVEWLNKDSRVDIIRKLREGHCSVQDILDLHGFTAEAAETELEEFLKYSLKRRYRCIKIIHGRGLRSANGPVLKKVVIKCLSGRFRKNIIAFVSARQCDGGLGALYVLLR
jgi:DNA-nicking Smr family endonuclease